MNRAHNIRINQALNLEARVSIKSLIYYVMLRVSHTYTKSVLECTKDVAAEHLIKQRLSLQSYPRLRYLYCD